MPDDLYHRDVLSWSEQQAGLLRRLAAGERVNDAVDWGNLIDEVETVGRSELNACESLLEEAMLHLLKLAAWPESLSARHWQAETIAFLGRAGRSYAPSMRQRIDLAGLYGRALRRARLGGDDVGVAGVLPEVCPFTLEGLLAEGAEPLELAALVR